MKAAPVAPAPRRGRPPRQAASGLRERAWWLIREVKQFTLDDLLFTLVEEDHSANADVGLGDYVRQLERVGVLRRLQRRAAGHGPSSPGRVIWRLRVDLGRQAPVWRRAERALWDPNGQRLIPPERTPGSPAASPCTPNTTEEAACEAA